MMKSIKTTHSLENGTDRYLVIGNSHEVISNHETEQEAFETLRTINVGDSKWGDIQVVAPQDKISGSYSRLLPPAHDEESAKAIDSFYKDIFGEE